MARSFVLTIAAVISLFGTGISDFDPSNKGVDDLASMLQVNDTVIDTVLDYLQEQELHLSTLREHIQDYSEEHEQAIRKLTQTLNALAQESSVHDEKKVQKKADEGDLSHLSKYVGTKFGKLCDGEVSLPAVIQKKLKCRYVDNGIPFLKMGPLKEEEAYLKPRIVLYHDVIYEEEIEDLKRLSEGRLYSSRTRNTTTGEAEISNDRIAKSAWLHDYQSRSMHLLTRRVEYITGLTTETAEELQVTHYDVGGLYEEHVDFAPKNDTKYFEVLGTGNRIATILFYLNDVVEGGGTVFYALNFTVWPQKGSAVFWHNLKRNGEGDESTLHGGCPVLSGTKWIATRWLHEKGQELIRPCTLLENE